MGPDLMEQFRAQAERFGAEMVAEDITAMDLTGEVKTVTDGYGNTYSARAVILAMGSGYRKLGLPDEDRLSGHGVSWCATCDGFFFRGQGHRRGRRWRLRGGGGDLPDPVRPLGHHHPPARRAAGQQDHGRTGRTRTPRSRFAWNSAVAAIHGDKSLTGVTLTDTVTGEQRELEVSGLFIAIGHDPRSELVRGQVHTDGGGYVVTDGKSTRTNLPGVFACGDLVDHTYRQAVTAAGTGCAAALDAERYLADLDDAGNMLLAEHEALLTGAAN